MKEYLLKMKTICDNLASCKQPISEEDQVSGVFVGLDLEYEPIVAALSPSPDSKSIQATCSFLLTSKIRVLRNSNSKNFMSANVEMHSRQPLMNTNSNGYGHGTNNQNRGRVKGRFSQNHNKPICQL